MLVGHCQYRRGRVALGHLAGDVRPGQNAGRMPGQYLLNDLAHPHVGALLKALDQ
ncbi:Uncharacterised protein [Mycobacterium tuberculosis]|nr:Uncharacterised protein [Mycobacterium tuberculosis]